MRFTPAQEENQEWPCSGPNSGRPWAGGGCALTTDFFLAAIDSDDSVSRKMSQLTLAAQTGRTRLQRWRPGFDSWVGKIPRRRERLPTAVFWPGEPHAQRSPAGYSPWGRREWDRTESGQDLDWLLPAPGSPALWECVSSLTRALVRTGFGRPEQATPTPH